MPFLARFLFLILAASAPTLARANEDLEQAVDLWLQGNDQQSLLMLADLARSGNADARLLLARIETNDLGPSPYRVSLPSAEARALFRHVPKGTVFGRTWLFMEAAVENELAQALMQAVRPEPDPNLIVELNRLGERQATDYPTRIIALYGSQEMKEALRQSPDLVPELRPYLDYLIGPPEPRGDGIAALRHITAGQEPVSADDPETLGMAGILALGYGYGDISASNRWRSAVEGWLLSAQATQPIADLCTSQCGSEAPSCAFAFLALLGGYYEVIRVDSPLEKLVPQERFLNSPRARLMVLRKAALARAETNLTLLADRAQIAEMSLCAANLIADERLAYQ
ncbi:MAG: hypothetical protein AB3N22_21245 [Ruegeria sp.]